MPNLFSDFLVVWLQTIDKFWLKTAKNRNLEKQKTQARAGKIIATALYRYKRTQFQKHNSAKSRRQMLVSVILNEIIRKRLKNENICRFSTAGHD